MLGIRRGYHGLFERGGIVGLDGRSVSRIAHRGGTILGTTNRGNPFSFPVRQADGTTGVVDRSDEVVARLNALRVDCLVAVGGDGSLKIASELAAKGLKVVGVPKTIDNDLDATMVTFGFHTAVQTATDAIGKLRSTAEAHERVMVVELMGRHAGWIALFAGVAAAADAILIPEIPHDLGRVAQRIRERWAAGHRFAIVVAAEGAASAGGEVSYLESSHLDRTVPGVARLGGVGKQTALRLEELTGHESRSLVLGHLQRGGQPIAFDRILATRFGAAAVELAAQGRFGCMVALDPPRIRAVPLAAAVGRTRTVPPDHDVIACARALGITFGSAAGLQSGEAARWQSGEEAGRQSVGETGQAPTVAKAGRR